MSDLTTMGVRRFGRVNWLGLVTLTRREISRFMTVWTQTVAAPLVTAGLFILIFTLAIGTKRGEVMGVPFVNFLVPGILMMTVIQNAFANTSSSIMIAKSQGNIVDTLMPPLSAGELLAGYVTGGVVRGLLVAFAIVTVMWLVLGQGVEHPVWLMAFVILGGTMVGGLGVIAAIVAQKFDQMAAITNFVITPLSFLSGTFYSVRNLPDTMQAVTHANPFFYLIDGARYGMLGISDSSPWVGLPVCMACCFLILAVCWGMFRSGYRLKA